MIGHRTYRYTRNTFGTLNFKNLYSHSFGYTETRKKAAAGTATAVLAATSGSTSAVTVTSGITDPDVPRCLSVTPGGTAAHIADSSVLITGTNIEGKVITEQFNTVSGSTTIINGTKAFKTVTSVRIGSQKGSGATFSVGTRDIFGVNHRLFRNNTTVKVYTATSVSSPSLTLQNAPTVVANESELERNTVQPASAPDGTKYFIIAYAFDNWSLAPLNDEPEYSTSTSTSSTSSSTSTTTGTTTSTSTSSTSSSSTSSSTSSTSSSTSSTSTSTTTVP